MRSKRIFSRRPRTGPTPQDPKATQRRCTPQSRRTPDPPHPGTAPQTPRHKAASERSSNQRNRQVAAAPRMLSMWSPSSGPASMTCAAWIASHTEGLPPAPGRRTRQAAVKCLSSAVSSFGPMRFPYARTVELATGISSVPAVLARRGVWATAAMTRGHNGRSMPPLASNATRYCATQLTVRKSLGARMPARKVVDELCMSWRI